MAKAKRSSSATPAAACTRSGWASAPTAARGTASRIQGADARRPRRRRGEIGDADRRPHPRRRGPDARPRSTRPTPRATPTGIGEFDRILGGGIVPGSAVLVGGEPGIGKSTLLLQVAELPRLGASARIGKSARFAMSVLYVTSEESARQTKLRAARLGVDCARTCSSSPRPTSSGSSTRSTRSSPAVVVDRFDPDDLQARRSPPPRDRSRSSATAAWSWSTSPRPAASRSLFVGHVTKAGTLAGPKIIEHIVDTVVYFEGDRFHSHRIVRCVKNRFGTHARSRPVRDDRRRPAGSDR